MRLLSAEEMKRVENHASQYGFSFQRMMENAGSACARSIRTIIENNKYTGKKATIICGSGNNGGDGFVIARKLKESGFGVVLIMASSYPETNESADMYKVAMDLSIPAVWYTEDRERVYRVLSETDYIIECIYGFGFHGEIPFDLVPLFDRINQSEAIKFSIDVPAGVYCNSGKFAEHCIEAQYTIAVSSLKPCHILYPGASMCGDIAVVNIGLPEESFQSITPALYTFSPRDVKAVLPKRDTTGNKGTFGHCLLICGSRTMVGAAELSAKAALRSGAGLVTVAFPECIYIPMSIKMTESLLLPLEANFDGTLSKKAIPALLSRLDKYDSILIGCGMGVNEDTKEVLNQVISNAKCPVIIDADGINILSDDINILRKAAVPVVLTPHPGEMARLVRMTIQNVQAERVAVAKNFARNYFVTMVLKGANTIVATDSKESVYVNSTGNTGLSKGGSGDLLAGLITGLIAQGMRISDACEAGVYIHGYLGDTVSEELSERGMLPGDMINYLSKVFADFS